MAPAVIETGAGGVRIREEDALHGPARGGDEFGVRAGRGHEHGMPAAVDVDFERVDVRAGQQFLPIAKDVGRQLARTFFSE